MKNRNILTALLTLFILIPFTVSSQNQITGEEAIYKVYNRAEGNDQSGKLVMTLINKRGDTRVREIAQFIKAYGNDEKKIMFFLSPSDVKNTSFMNWSYDEKGKNDDQWIYLPALKKVKRISSDSKGDSFMGSDFTYDDLGDRHPSSDTHNLLKEEIIDGEKYLVVESVTKDDDYIYSKTVTWIMPDKWIGYKKDFYDEDGDLLKTLTVKDYRQINGYWIITESEMHNVQKDHTTVMKLSDLKLDTGIPDSKFTERMMKRGHR